MKHTDEPAPGSLSAAELEAILERHRKSEYVRYLASLQAAVSSKVVASSQAGVAGFILAFTDGTWTTAYLAGDRLAYELGSGAPSAAALAHLNPTGAGDGSEPLTYDRPYAHEHCDIAAEVSRSHGHRIVGLAYGADSFNFRFPEGMELDTALVTDAKGLKALRVFWEQW